MAASAKCRLTGLEWLRSLNTSALACGMTSTSRSSWYWNRGLLRPPLMASTGWVIAARSLLVKPTWASMSSSMSSLASHGGGGPSGRERFAWLYKQLPARRDTLLCWQGADGGEAGPERGLGGMPVVVPDHGCFQQCQALDGLAEGQRCR
jgi:hypothetical protein